MASCIAVRAGPKSDLLLAASAKLSLKAVYATFTFGPQAAGAVPCAISAAFV